MELNALALHNQIRFQCRVIRTMSRRTRATDQNGVVWSPRCFENFLRVSAKRFNLKAMLVRDTSALFTRVPRNERT